MQITVSPEVERELVRHADVLGTSPEDVANDALRERFLPNRNGSDEVSDGEEVAAAEGGESLYDFLKEFIGSIDSSEHVPGGANMSVDTGKKFTEIVYEKHRGNRGR
jgi:hypothetical protein